DPVFEPKDVAVFGPGPDSKQIRAQQSRSSSMTTDRAEAQQEKDMPAALWDGDFRPDRIAAAIRTSECRRKKPRVLLSIYFMLPRHLCSPRTTCGPPPLAWRH